MNSRKFLFLLPLLIAGLLVRSQVVQPMNYTHYSFPYNVNIGSGKVRPTNPSAFLEVGDSTGSKKGVLLPGGNIGDIVNPVQRLLLFDSASQKYWFYNGTSWEILSAGYSAMRAGDSTAHSNGSSPFTFLSTDGKLTFQVVEDDPVYGDYVAVQVNEDQFNVGLQRDLADSLYIVDIYKRSDSLFVKKNGVETLLDTIQPIYFDKEQFDTTRSGITPSEPVLINVRDTTALPAYFVGYNPTNRRFYYYTSGGFGGGGGAVSSVFGRTGAVTAQSSDYSSFYPLLSGTYNNPSWLNQLAWPKITGTPTTLGGYGITDAFNGDYNNLANKPTIPTNTNQLTNGAGFLTAETDPKRLQSLAVTGTTTKTITATLADASTVTATFTDLSGSGGGSGIDSVRLKSAGSDSTMQYSGGVGSFAFRRQRVFNVRDYGATGDSTQDATSAIQAATDAAFNAGGGTVYFPNGIYSVKGSLNGVTNSQIVIPAAGNDRTRAHVRYLGEGAPNFSPVALYQDSPVVWRGPIIHSTIQGTGTAPAIFGGTGSGGTFTLNYASFENLIIYNKANAGTTGPTMTAINGRELASVWVNNCVIGVDSSLYRDTIPVNQVAGIVTTRVGGETMSGVKNTLVFGYRYGVVAGEHCNLENVNAWGCYAGFVIQKTSHPIYATKLTSQWNTIDVLVPNSTLMGIPSGATNFVINELSVETYTNPAVGTRWFQSVKNIVDSGNNAKGFINYRIADQGGAQITLTKYAADSMRLLPLTNVGILPSPLFVSPDRTFGNSLQVARGDGVNAYRAIGANDSYLRNNGNGDVVIFNGNPTGSVKLAPGNAFSTSQFEVNPTGTIIGTNAATTTVNAMRLYTPALASGASASSILGRDNSNGFYWNYLYHSTFSNQYVSLQNINVNPGTNSLTYTYNGDVGVGTTTPVAKFSVVGNSVDSGNHTTYGILSASGSAGIVQANGTGTDLVKIIGSNASRAGLYAQTTNAAAQTTFYFENNRGSFASYGGLLYGGSTNSTGNLFGQGRADRLVFFADGASNLGMSIGTLSNQSLTFGTNNTERMVISNAGAVRMNTYTAGTATFDGSGNITSSSDQRIKHSIRPFTYGLAAINLIHPASFIYNSDSSNTRMNGFIAQDVQKAIPGAVHVGKDKEGTLSLETNAILAALVNAVKEQQQQIETLKKEIETLKATTIKH